MSSLFLLLLSPFAVAACQGGDGRAAVATHDPNIMAISASDPEIAAAMRRARETVPELLARLASPPSTQTFISVKVRLADGAEVEHVWLDSLTWDGQRFSGRLNDEPVAVSGFHEGDLVRVAPSEITDWLAIDGGRLCGGYVLRVQQRRASAGTRAALKRDSGLIRVPSDTSSCEPAA